MIPKLLPRILFTEGKVGHAEVACACHDVLEVPGIVVRVLDLGGGGVVDGKRDDGHRREELRELQDTQTEDMVQ